MRYSVVVPTRDRAAPLERCLRAVAAAAPGSAAHRRRRRKLSTRAAVEAVARRHGRTSSGSRAAARRPRETSASAAPTAGIVLFTERRLRAAARMGRGARSGGRRRTGPHDRGRHGPSQGLGTSTCGPRSPSSRRSSVRRRSARPRTSAATGGMVHYIRSTSRSPRRPVRTGTGARASWRQAGASTASRRQSFATCPRREPGPSGAGMRATAGECAGSGRTARSASAPGLAFRVVSDGFRNGIAVGVLVVVAQLATLAGYLGAPRR